MFNMMKPATEEEGLLELRKRLLKAELNLMIERHTLNLMLEAKSKGVDFKAFMAERVPEVFL